jgi:iron-sulfur cluster repair protein YtfE (RIC family)
MADLDRTPDRSAADRIVAEVVRRHEAERRALPYITSLLPKIAGRFRGRDARVDVLCDAGQDLADALETYMEVDERRLVPAAAAGGNDLVRGELDRRHGELEAMLAHVRALARDFVTPEWGDEAYRALMEELEALEREVKARIDVEERELVAAPGADLADPPHLRRATRLGRGPWVRAADEEE